MDPVRIFVLRREHGWWVRVRETTSPYATETAAIELAMTEARNLASAGFYCEVVMPMLTCPFGPKGMGKVFPTRGWAGRPEIRDTRPGV